MPGSTWGHALRLTTFGESHGVALGGIIDGFPAGVTIDMNWMQQQLARRRPGQAWTTPRQEQDQVEVLSGVFEGQTTGTPIALLIRNADQRSQDYAALKDQLRPGHADGSYLKKYGIRDHRGGGRASARETVIRVAAGALAQQYLAEQLGIQIQAGVTQIDQIQATECDFSQVPQNPFGFVDAHSIPTITALFEQLIAAGDSVGAAIRVEATGVPAGLGEPVFDKLDALLAHAWMSINAVKAVAVGDGWDVVSQRGHQHRDALGPAGFLSNHAGGVLGGISTGQTIVGQLAFKPTSSIQLPIDTLNQQGQMTTLQVKGRHDPCVALRALPIVEAMTALTLMDQVLQQRAQNPKVWEQANDAS